MKAVLVFVVALLAGVFPGLALVLVVKIKNYQEAKRVEAHLDAWERAMKARIQNTWEFYEKVRSGN